MLKTSSNRTFEGKWWEKRKQKKLHQKLHLNFLSLLPEIKKLGFKTKDILAMAGAIIVGSILMNAKLASVAKLTCTIINSFDDLTAKDSDKIISILADATQRNVLDFQTLVDILPVISPYANTAGISFEKLISFLEINSNKKLV